MSKYCDICNNEIKFYQLTHRYLIEENKISLCKECNSAYGYFVLNEIMKRMPEKDKSVAMATISQHHFTKDYDFQMTKSDFDRFRNNYEKYKVKK